MNNTKIRKFYFKDLFFLICCIAIVLIYNLFQWQDLRNYHYLTEASKLYFQQTHTPHLYSMILEYMFELYAFVSGESAQLLFVEMANFKFIYSLVNLSIFSFLFGFILFFGLFLHTRYWLNSKSQFKSFILFSIALVASTQGLYIESLFPFIFLIAFVGLMLSLKEYLNLKILRFITVILIISYSYFSFYYLYLLLPLYVYFYFHKIDKYFNYILYLAVITIGFSLYNSFHRGQSVTQIVKFVELSKFERKSLAFVGNSELFPKINLSDSLVHSRRMHSQVESSLMHSHGQTDFTYRMFSELDAYELLNLHLKSGISNIILHQDAKIDSSFMDLYLSSEINDFAFYELPKFSLKDTLSAPVTPENMMFNGILLYHFGKIERALYYLKKLYNPESTTTEQLIFIASLFYENGDLLKSLNTYNFIIQKEKRCLKAYQSRAEILFQLKKFSSAASDYSVLINSKKYSADIFYNRAICYMKLNRNRSYILKDLKAAHKLGKTEASHLITTIEGL